MIFSVISIVKMTLKRISNLEMRSAFAVVRSVSRGLSVAIIALFAMMTIRISMSKPSFGRSIGPTRLITDLRSRSHQSSREADGAGWSHPAAAPCRPLWA